MRGYLRVNKTLYTQSVVLSPFNHTVVHTIRVVPKTTIFTCKEVIVTTERKKNLVLLFHCFDALIMTYCDGWVQEKKMTKLT